MAKREHSDFHPTATWPILRRRAELLASLRDFFRQRQFLEVETPLLSADSVIDRHLDPLAVTLFDDPTRPADGRTMWLQTSPEFAMKRLLAAGGDAIFQIARAFRAGERGRLHNPEFTIVEWYRVGDDLRSGMQLLGDLANELLAAGPPEFVTYREAFSRLAGIDPLSATNQQLMDHVRAKEVAVPAGLSPADRDAWLDLLLTACVEPQLGVRRPTIVYDYPASQAALAVIRDEDPPVAERFELYFRGIELANGYHELLDAEVLRRRNRTNNRLRAGDGKFTLPPESQLLTAMDSGLPPCAGVALGFDRLVMLAVGAASIDEVIAFPIDRA